LEIDQKEFDEGKHDWHRDWKEGQIDYLKREIKKRQKYIRQLEELEF
jgi:hypothetical protein